MVYGLLIAAAVSAILAGWIWHRVNAMGDDDSGLIAGIFGILLVAAGITWIVRLF